MLTFFKIITFFLLQQFGTRGSVLDKEAGRPEIPANTPVQALLFIECKAGQEELAIVLDNKVIGEMISWKAENSKVIATVVYEAISTKDRQRLSEKLYHLMNAQQPVVMSWLVQPSQIDR